MCDDVMHASCFCSPLEIPTPTTNKHPHHPCTLLLVVPFVQATPPAGTCSTSCKWALTACCPNPSTCPPWSARWFSSRTRRGKREVTLGRERGPLPAHRRREGVVGGFAVSRAPSDAAGSLLAVLGRVCVCVIVCVCKFSVQCLALGLPRVLLGMLFFFTLGCFSASVCQHISVCSPQQGPPSKSDCGSRDGCR